MNKIFIAFVFTMLSQTTFAKTLCLCQTGGEPSAQIPAFKAGCRLWLLGQKQCDEKKIAPEDSSLSQLLNEDLREGQLQLGYVGHWSGSHETIEYITSKVLPIASILQLDVKIDNTACSGMDDAFKVQRFLTKIKSQGFRKKIEFKGNQTTSIGMWNTLFSGDYNFFATASTESKFPDFPLCREFESESCSQLFQEGEGGYCKNDSNQLEKLTCQTITKEVVSPSVRGGPREIRKVKTNAWVKTDANKIEEIHIIGKNDDGQIVDVNDPSVAKLIIMKGDNQMYSLGVNQKDLIKYIEQNLQEEVNKSVDDIKAWNNYMRSRPI